MDNMPLQPQRKNNDLKTKQHSDLETMLGECKQQLDVLRSQYTALCQNNRNKDAILKVYEQKRALDEKM